MKSMKVKRYLQGLLLIICLLVTSCAQIMAVNADEQDVSLEITLEDESNGGCHLQHVSDHRRHHGTRRTVIKVYA